MFMFNSRRSLFLYFRSFLWAISLLAPACANAGTPLLNTTHFGNAFTTSSMVRDENCFHCCVLFAFRACTSAFLFLPLARDGDRFLFAFRPCDCRLSFSSPTSHACPHSVVSRFLYSLQLWGGAKPQMVFPRLTPLHPLRGKSLHE